MSLTFAWPWALVALPLPLLAAGLPRVRPQPRAALRLPFSDALDATATPGAERPSPWRLALALLAWVLLVAAATRPQFVDEALQLPVSGRDLLLAVDISGSMQTEDMVIDGKPTSRLAAVKAIAGNFIERRRGDRLGLILFGDQAYLQTPLTFDRKTVHRQLDEAAIGLAGRRTAIGDAIGLAIKRLREQPQKNRVLILLTDGANTAGVLDPLKAAQLAQRAGVRIYTIGVGADTELVQGLFGPQRIANRDLDEHSLIAIADTTGGRYFRARDSAALEKIYRLLDRIEPVSHEQQTFRPVQELYAWPLGSALILTLLLALWFAPGRADLLQRRVVRNVEHA